MLMGWRRDSAGNERCACLHARWIKLASAALFGIWLLCTIQPASAQDRGAAKATKLAMLLPAKVLASGAEIVNEAMLTKQLGKGGVAAGTSPVVIDVSSVKLWDEYLPKRGASNNMSNTNIQVNFNVGRTQ